MSIGIRDGSASAAPLISRTAGQWSPAIQDSQTICRGSRPFRVRDLKEAAAAVAEIDSGYTRHSRAARKIAEAHFNSRACLEAMIAASQA
jgi:hypothetical protein